MQTSYKLSKLVEYVSGELIGDGQCQITGIVALDKAGPGQLSFLSDSRYRDKVSQCDASALLVGEEDRDVQFNNRIVVQAPYQAAVKIAQLFSPKRQLSSGIHDSAVVAESAQIDASASIGPKCVISEGVRIGANAVIEAGVFIGPDCRVGANTHIQPNSVIYAQTEIGDRVQMKPNATIGGIGYGLNLTAQKTWEFIPHAGRVIIGDDVSIGSSNTIDRGSFDDTVIGEGVKLDNQIQVAHNVHIGPHTVIAAGVAIGGSTHIGSYCMIGGGCIIRDHLQITDRVNIIGASVVGRSLEQPGSYSGSAFDIEHYKSWFKKLVIFKDLEKLHRSVKQLEKAHNGSAT